VEEHGPLTLFVKQGAGWPYYARPALPARGDVTAADVAAVRARQRELGIDEAFEWVPETTPSALGAARAAGMQVLEAPLMVVREGRWRTPEPPQGYRARVLAAADPALAAAQAVVQVAFEHGGTAAGEAGEAERDAAAAAQTAEGLARMDDRMRRGLTVRVVAERVPDAAADAGGATAAVVAPAAAAGGGTAAVVAAGSHQPVEGVSEIVGVGTLPCARRRGLGALVTAHLVADARERGADLVFLAAGSEEIARVYGRLGFERVGTACIASAPGTAAP
jgi:ribosomal protein S18 acetylase RimI-like enzyme